MLGEESPDKYMKPLAFQLFGNLNAWDGYHYTSPQYKDFSLKSTTFTTRSTTPDLYNK